MILSVPLAIIKIVTKLISFKLDYGISMSLNFAPCCSLSHTVPLIAAGCSGAVESTLFMLTHRLWYVVFVHFLPDYNIRQSRAQSRFWRNSNRKIHTHSFSHL